MSRELWKEPEHLWREHFSLTLGLTCLPIGKDTSIVAFKGILKNILSKALENNILT